MSNGIASGVPPAAGGAGGAAGGGVCAKADEPSAATAQAATVIEKSDRIVVLRVDFLATIACWNAPVQHPSAAIIPESTAHSTLILASRITLRQRASSP